jgi:micrococcal nuclease
MQILPILLTGAMAILGSDPVLVRAVIDGDTIDVAGVGRVRLLGIDAPELGRVFDTPAPFAREAKDRLTSLVLHRWVTLESDGQTLDAYSRRLAYVITGDGVLINAVIVREGLARVTARLPLKRLVELQNAEAEAQTFRRGMWGATPSVPPASYTPDSGATKSPARKYKQPAQKKKTKTKKPKQQQ